MARTIILIVTGLLGTFAILFSLALNLDMSILRFFAGGPQWVSISRC